MIRAVKSGQYRSCTTTKNIVDKMGLGTRFTLWRDLKNAQNRNATEEQVQGTIHASLSGRDGIAGYYGLSLDDLEDFTHDVQECAGGELLKKNFKKYNILSRGDTNDIKRWGKIDIDNFMAGYEERECGFGGIYGKGTGIKQEFDNDEDSSSGESSENLSEDSFS